MKVLLALDNSQSGEAALQAVIERPWWGDTEFHVISVAPVLCPAFNDFSPHYHEITRIQQADKKMAEDLVQKAAEKLAQALPNCLVCSSVAEGNVPDKIIDKANEWEADLIVLGSHGRTGLTKVLLGSVAEAVLQRAQCSVEIVKMHTEERPQAHRHTHTAAAN